MTVDVKDYFGSLYVYVQGAPSVKSGGLFGTVTFDDVADFGPGVLQPSIGIAGLDRVVGDPPYADVQPGQTVPGGNLTVNDRFRLPRVWRRQGVVEGRRHGARYNHRLGTAINAISPVRAYGLWGDALPVVPETSTPFHSWNPTLAGNNQYLYYSTDMKSDAAHGIFLNTVGDASGGEEALPPALAPFLPNARHRMATGRIRFPLQYEVHVGVGPRLHMRRPDYHTCHNIFEYDLATGRITQRTNIDDQGVMGMAVSPDGQYILFERTTDPVFDPTSSLWIVKRDDRICAQALDDAGRPAWGQTPSFPTPTITNLNPSSVAVGSPAFTLTVNGADSVSDSIVRWNGSDRATTYVNGTRLTASITAANIVTAGSASVTVFNPAPGGGTSNARTFQINITNPFPRSQSQSSQCYRWWLGVHSDSQWRRLCEWLGRAQERERSVTMYVNNTRLTASIPAADIATAGFASVTVFNPTPGGGTSNTATFSITIWLPLHIGYTCLFSNVEGKAE